MSEEMMIFIEEYIQPYLEALEDNDTLELRALVRRKRDEAIVLWRSR